MLFTSNYKEKLQWHSSLLQEESGIGINDKLAEKRVALEKLVRGTTVTSEQEPLIVGRAQRAQAPRGGNSTSIEEKRRGNM